MNWRILMVLFLALGTLFWLMSVITNSGAVSSSEVASSGVAAGQAFLGASTPPAQGASPSVRRESVIAKVLASLSTPVLFYGKVVDQNGLPVIGAKVSYGALDRFADSGSQYQGESDANGFFSIGNIHGAALMVGVQKQGYYMIDGKSSATFSYEDGVRDPTLKERPTADNPAVFVLRKMGASEPLIHVRNRQINMASSGQSLRIDITTGISGRGDLIVTSWMGNVEQRPFEWRYELRMPDGGLIERGDQFSFEAPSSGYQETFEVSMSVNVERWTSQVTREYFAKLGDGRYARFSIRFYAGRRNFVVFESYVNPVPGNRNLEFDPKKVIRQ